MKERRCRTTERSEPLRDVPVIAIGHGSRAVATWLGHGPAFPDAPRPQEVAPCSSASVSWNLAIAAAMSGGS
jgi:hypothetical protein